MDLAGQLLDARAQLLRERGQLRVLLEQLEQLRRVIERDAEALLARRGDRLAVLRVGFRMRLVAVGLSRLGEQDERCRVGGLRAEREVQQDERIGVEGRPGRRVDVDPDDDDQRLPDQEARRPEEAALAAEVIRGLNP